MSLFRISKKREIKNSDKLKRAVSPVVLVVLDGFGISPIKENNAVYIANTPNIDYYQKNYPKTLLFSSGEEVGLPFGEFGNSEVGHLNIGAGRVVYQPLLRVSNEISSGGLEKNKTLDDLKKHLKKTKGTLHLAGLLSAGGVHSHIEHLLNIIDWCKKNDIKKVALHIFTDGRDSPPYSAEIYLNIIEEKIKETKLNCVISSVSGRFFAMDREKKWKNLKKAYNAIIGISKKTSNSPKSVIEENYEEKKTDEFLEPHTITDKNGSPLRPVVDGDGFLFFNIRSDRTREMVSAFTENEFNSFSIRKFSNLFVATLTEYNQKLKALPVFPEKNIELPLGEILSKTKKTQLRIAESAKYPHVTYFFNGGREKPFKGEKRVLVKSIAASQYETKPEMSAEEIKRDVIDSLEKDRYDFILVNFANPDMLGHTGNIKATIKGIEFLDKCVKEIADVVINKNGALIITSDHGNSEEMVNSSTGEKDTEHNIYPVPFIVISSELKNKKEGYSFKEAITNPVGSLSDIAPTILEIMKVEKPKEMEGISLLDSLK